MKKATVSASVVLIATASMIAAILAIGVALPVLAYEPDESINWVDCPRFDDALSTAPDSAFEKPDISYWKIALENRFGWLWNLWSAPSTLPISYAASSADVPASAVIDGREVSIEELIMETLSADYSDKKRGPVRDQSLSTAFKWIDRLISPFSSSLATTLKIKSFNAIAESKRKKVRSIASMASRYFSPESSNYSPQDSIFGAIQCAKVRVPLRWDKPDHEQGILFHVKRFLVPDPSKRKGILWLIQGGPGADGSVFHRLAESLMQAFDNRYDLYVEDHRGVGRSTIVECRGENLNNREVCYNEVKKQWGIDGLHGFTASGAARDILHVSKLIKNEQGGQVALFGGSYGTYVVNRILTIDKGETIDLAIADGLARPGFNFFFWDEGQDRTGKLLLEKCVESEFCSEKFGITKASELEQMMLDMYSKQQNKESACGMDETMPKLGLMRLLSLFLQMGISRDFIAPLIYRALRCNDADKIALDNFVYTFGETIKDLDYPVEKLQPGESILDYELRKTVESEVSKTFTTLDGRAPYEWDPKTEGSYSMSYELMFNIKASEFTGAPDWPERESLVELFNKEGRLFGVGAGVSEYDSVTPRIKPSGNGKPETYDDPLASKWATDYTGPLLMMTGDLDPQTTLLDGLYWERTYENKTLYPNHFFTVFGGVHHIQILNALTRDHSSSCGLTVAASFLASDGQSIDTTCMTEHMHQVYPFHLTTSVEVTALFSADFWDGTPLHMRSIVNLLINIAIAVVVCAVACCVCCCLVCVTVCVCCVCVIRKNKDQGGYGQLQGSSYAAHPTPQYYQNY